MAQARFSTPSKLDEARAWLRTALADGNPQSAGEIQEHALRVGIKRRTLQLAAQDVAVIERKYGARGIEAWQWKLKGGE